jgi:general secretion pathway protein C
MKFRRPTVENEAWTWWLGCALSLCLLLGAIAYWASIWLAPAVRIAPAGTLSDQSGPLNLGQAQGLFGQVASATPQVVAAAQSNIKVVGILAAGQKGSAILAIDGKPGKVYMLGDIVEGQLKVISVDVRQVTLGQDGTTARQALAAPPKAQISVLTQGPAKAAGGANGTGTPNLPTSTPPVPGFGLGAGTSPTSPITPPPSTSMSTPVVIAPGTSGSLVNGMPFVNPNLGLQPNPSNQAAPPGGPNPGSPAN